MTTARTADRRGLDFDPLRIGFIEARLWHAYYARHWTRVALLLYRLLREQLGLPPWAALRAMRHGSRAAVAFAPVANDLDATQRELRAFYRVVAGATALAADADAAADAELDYWRIHRAIVGQPERAPLIDALARIPAAIYGVPPASLLPSATERERAVRLVDRITGGSQPSTDAAWREIAASLTRSYVLLREAIGVSRAAERTGVSLHDSATRQGAESGYSFSKPNAAR